MRSLAFVSALSALLFVAAGCESYNDAELACQEDFELENACRASGGVATMSIEAEQQCASALSYLDDDEAAIQDKVLDYECSIEAWTAADCSDEAGVAAASEVATDCFF